MEDRTTRFTVGPAAVLGQLTSALEVSLLVAREVEEAALGAIAAARLVVVASDDLLGAFGTFRMVALAVLAAVTQTALEISIRTTLPLPGAASIPRTHDDKAIDILLFYFVTRLT